MTKKLKIILTVSAVVAVVLIVLFNKQISGLLNIFGSRAALDQGSITLDGNNFFNGVVNNSFKLDAQNRLVLNINSSPISGRHFLSLNNPNNYNETDILNFVDLDIDIHNWATINGGKMTPYRNGDGTYYLDTAQKNLIDQLYTKGERVFWIGITLDHVISFGFPAIYTELCSAIDAYVAGFNELSLTDAEVGVYTGSYSYDLGLGQDEIITNIRPGYTRAQQYAFSETTRSAVKSACGSNWNKVKWLITGQDNILGFQLTNDAQSYWAHHTNVSTTSDVEDMVYHDDYTIMSSQAWKNTWGSFSKLAWTDTGLVQGTVGNRTLSSLGQSLFGN